MKTKLTIAVTVLCVAMSFPPAATAAATQEADQEATQGASQEAGQDPLFGLQMGMSKEQIESKAGAELAPVEGEPFLYDAPAVPDPSPRFDIYGLVVAPEAGLCQIRALGVNVQTDPAGTELKQEFAELREMLAGRYGEHRLTDELRADSELAGDNQWMESLLKNERVYQAIWAEEEGSSLGETLAHVGISARALNVQVGYVALQYSFANVGICREEAEAAEGGEGAR